MNNEMSGLTKTHGSKVSDLKSLYGFRLMLKRKIIEFKKMIGQEFDQEQAMQTVWNSMDPRSTDIAMADGLDSGD